MDCDKYEWTASPALVISQVQGLLRRIFALVLIHTRFRLVFHSRLGPSISLDCDRLWGRRLSRGFRPLHCGGSRLVADVIPLVLRKVRTLF